MSDRRDLVPFDPRYFEKRSSGLSLRERFSHIYKSDLWSGKDSVSGAGASRDQTRVLEAELPRLLRHLEVDILLDVPCGDFGWMQHVDLPVKEYIGGDIVQELMASNQERYGRDDRRFVPLDLTSDPLPPAGLLLCRDALVHLSVEDIFAALRNVKESHITYFLTTTFPDHEKNVDIRSGDWRLLNLEKPPFEFPEPLLLINERCTEGAGAYEDKSLGLWRVTDIPVG